MKIKKKIMNLVLSKSNSYNFYKSEFQKNKNENEKFEELELKIFELKKDIDNFKQTHEENFDSINYLFNTLFLDLNLNKPTKLLNYIQLLSMELLIFVNNVCIKHDLEYWLDYGNLLGAIRHGYFVPWDDDVDIGMMREEYLKFEKVFYDEVKFYGLDDIITMEYRPREIDGETIGSFIQIFVKHKTWISGDRKPILAGVDVFPYDFIKEFNEETIETDHYNSKINLFKNIKNKYDVDYCLNNYYKELNLSFEVTDFLIPGVEGACGLNNLYNFIIFETNKIFPLKKINFGDKIFPAPNDTHYYLESIYGDYLTIPKSLRRHGRVDWYRYNRDNDEVFTECITKLKDVNSKFLSY